MEQQKQQKASEKIFGINKKRNKQQNNKSKSKVISVSCDQSTPQQTNEKCRFPFSFFSAYDVCTHSEPGNRTKHGVHVWLHVYVVGSYDWHRL